MIAKLCCVQIFSGRSRSPKLVFAASGDSINPPAIVRLATPPRGFLVQRHKTRYAPDVEAGWTQRAISDGRPHDVWTQTTPSHGRLRGAPTGARTWDPGITIGVSRGGSNVPVLSCAAAVLATTRLG